MEASKIKENLLYQKMKIENEDFILIAIVIILLLLFRLSDFGNIEIIQINTKKFLFIPPKSQGKIIKELINFKDYGKTGLLLQKNILFRVAQAFFFGGAHKHPCSRSWFFFFQKSIALTQINQCIAKVGWDNINLPRSSHFRLVLSPCDLSLRMIEL